MTALQNASNASTAGATASDHSSEQSTLLVLVEFAAEELDQVVMVGEDVRTGTRRQAAVHRSAFVATLRVAMKARQVAAVRDFDFDVMHRTGRNELPVCITLRLALLAVFGRFFGSAGAFDGRAHRGVHVIPSVNYWHDCLLSGAAFTLRGVVLLQGKAEADSLKAVPT
jgi:hypothetical protein